MVGKWKWQTEKKKQKTGEYTQVYSYKNKEQIFLTSLCFCNWSGKHGSDYNHVFPLGIFPSFAFQKHLGYS